MNVLKKLSDKCEWIFVENMVSFYQWISSYRKEASPVGDLARDLLRDTRKPTGTLVKGESTILDFKSLREYMCINGACQEALDTLSKARTLYKRHRGTLSR